MVSNQSRSVAERAISLYESELRAGLEAGHRNCFVAIEPESGEYFLGDTLSAAIQAARAAHPNRIAYTLRVGHPTAINLGVMAT